MHRGCIEAIEEIELIHREIGDIVNTIGMSVGAEPRMFGNNNPELLR